MIIALITIALLVAISDQVAMLFKNTWVQRLRPFREPALEGLISKVGKSGGTYGFYSGHASNAMALAVFMWHLLKQSHKTTGILLFIWAVLVAYSRVYLGVHYPGDVLMGMFMGTVIGWLCYRLFAFAKRNMHQLLHHPRHFRMKKEFFSRYKLSGKKDNLKTIKLIPLL